MSRTIDATLPPLEESSGLGPGRSSDCDLTDLSNHRRLPKPLQILPPSDSDECCDVSQTVLYQIRSLTHKQNTGIPLTTQEEDALDDGFMLCDIRTVQRKLLSWRRMFPRIKPFFALKCNPDVMIAHTLGLDKLSCGFDCASIAEIHLALSATSNDPRRIVYANPQRAKRDLEQALELNVGAFTFDGIEELHKVKEAYAKHLEEWNDRSRCDLNENHEEKEDGNNPSPSSSSSPSTPLPLPPQMILRLLVPDGHSSVPLGEKFGAPPDRVEELTEEALELGFDVIGVSFHCGSGCHDAEAYGAAIRIASDAIGDINQVIKRWNAKQEKIQESQGDDNDGGRTSSMIPRFVPECTLLDIGGGYPGLCGIGSDVQRFSSRPSDFDSIPGTMLTDCYSDTDETAYTIAKVVTPLVDELFPPESSPIRIISEPGRYFVEGAFIYCARIYSAKVGGGDDGKRHYYIAQGVQGLFKDVLLCDETFIPTPLKVTGINSSSSDNTASCMLFPSIVHGPSSEDFDIVSKDCMLPALNVGDWLIFDRMGAYTLSIAARNSSLPVRYVLGGGGRSDGDDGGLGTNKCGGAL